MANYTLGLDNLISLIRAELRNTPFISSFEHIKYEAKRVQRGDLFIALNPFEIKNAIANGAYGIIHEGNIVISDDEIAWLKVDNIKDALLRLLRFHLMQKSLKVYSVDDITLELFHSIAATKVVILEDSIEDNLKTLFSLDDESVVIYQINSLYEDLFTTTKSVYELENSYSVKVEESTLFETSFIYKEHLYERISLSKLLLPNIQKMFNILEDASIEFKVKPFMQSHFSPIFINKHFKAVEFGQSSKVLICENDLKLFVEAISFLKENAPWAKSLFFIDKENVLKIEAIKEITVYTNENDLVKKLKESDFDFALLFNQAISLLDNSNFSATPQQLSLF